MTDEILNSHPRVLLYGTKSTQIQLQSLEEGPVEGDWSELGPKGGAPMI